MAWGVREGVDPAAPLIVLIPGNGEFSVYGATHDSGGIVLVAKRDD
jgi:hypothetical protein